VPPIRHTEKDFFSASLRAKMTSLFPQHTMQWFKRHCTCMVGSKERAFLVWQQSWRDCHGDERDSMWDHMQISTALSWPEALLANWVQFIENHVGWTFWETLTWKNEHGCGCLESTTWNNHCLGGI
jgi:hypothetical protein